MSIGTKIEATGLNRLQKVLWYLLLVWFAFVFVACLVLPSIAADLARWGVIMIVLITALRIVALGEIFRRKKLYRFWLLACTLVLVLISTVLLKYFTQ